MSIEKNLSLDRYRACAEGAVEEMLQGTLGVLQALPQKPRAAGCPSPIKGLVCTLSTAPGSWL